MFVKHLNRSLVSGHVVPGDQSVEMSNDVVPFSIVDQRDQQSATFRTRHLTVINKNFVDETVFFRLNFDEKTFGHDETTMRTAGTRRKTQSENKTER